MSPEQAEAVTQAKDMIKYFVVDIAGAAITDEYIDALDPDIEADNKELVSLWYWAKSVRQMWDDMQHFDVDAYSELTHGPDFEGAS